jgi:SAM-dependent methyltransferase
LVAVEQGSTIGVHRVPNHAVTRDTVGRIASRDSRRTEATLQADIRQFLLLSQFDLDADEVREINLETQLGDGTRRRIDIEAGNTVIEVKKDLGVGNVLTDAVTQLSGYVRDQSFRLGRRYVGILTDGVVWRLYHLDPDGETLTEVSSICLAGTDAMVAETLTTWLDTILATAQNIPPLPHEIERRLGAQSASYQLDYASLKDLFEAAAQHPDVQLKKELWAKLLRTSFGSSFVDSQQLFIDHTLLVLTAEVIAHAVVGYDLAAMALTPKVLVSGQSFRESQVYGVVEADFFDWVVEVEGGPQFVTSLTQRLARFNWQNVEHDVLKVLYESVISSDIRHTLGEYYTPDWLANRIVAEVYTDPLNQRVLDPSCGSGTFVFQAVKSYLAATDQEGIPNGDALDGLTRHVLGVDVHPVAVIFARVTYLLAIGGERWSAPDRRPLNIPVYLGDSVQWDKGEGTIADGNIRIATAGNDLSDTPTTFFPEMDLVFPESIVDDASRFDRIVAILADEALRYTGGKVPSIKGPLHPFQLSDDETQILTQTFDVMCHLHESGRDHIWGYYVRNLIRPLWLSNRDANRIDVLVGNVPWLAYASMTATMQERFTELSKQRRLLTTNRGVSGRDLSALFVVRSIERYLRPRGQFAFVMPHAALTRKPYAGFRTGCWSSDTSALLAVSFSTPWDLDNVQPDIFPVPSCVVFGRYIPNHPHPMAENTIKWSGGLPRGTVDWDVAQQYLAQEQGSVRQVAESDVLPASPYRTRFREGAVLCPRALIFVKESSTNVPLGAGEGRTHIEAFRSTQENKRWKSIPTLRGTVEKSQLFPTFLGETVLPFRTVKPRLAALPITEDRLMTPAEIDCLPAFGAWWDQAESVWEDRKKPSDKSRLLDRVDTFGQLSAQLPVGGNLVVYQKTGNNLTAAHIDDPRALIDHTLYWGLASSPAEARYLLTILNSRTLCDRVAPFQARSIRHFDKYVFRVPIPEFKGGNSLHVALAELGEEAETQAHAVDVQDMGCKAARSRVRNYLAKNGLAEKMEAAVRRLLDSSS